MPDATAQDAYLELLEKSLKIANLQADATLKLAQSKVVIWQAVIPAAIAGAATAVAFMALGHYL